MNPETGRIYYGDEEIEAARGRGEPLIELSPAIADSLTALEKKVQEANAQARCPRNRAERRALKFGHKVK